MSGNGRRLIPDDVDPSRLPDPFINEDGEPLSLSEAATTYLRLARFSWNRDDYTSPYEYARHIQYPRILDADRYFQDSFDGLTTCLLVRNVSPFDEDNTRLTPWELNEMLHSDSIRRSVREAIDYHLDGFEFEWVAVTTPETRWGAPYELMYLWVNDAGNNLTVDHLEPALERHVERCANANWEDHEYRDDGSDGVIQIRHDPPFAEQVPEQYPSIFGETDHTPNPSTRGALHVATNLPDLVVGDYYNSDEPDPRDMLVEGAAVGYAVPHNWVRFSAGVPDLRE